MKFFIPSIYPVLAVGPVVEKKPEQHFVFLLAA
jgi:hypothetical protein